MLVSRDFANSHHVQGQKQKGRAWQIVRRNFVGGAISKLPYYLPRA